MESASGDPRASAEVEPDWHDIYYDRAVIRERDGDYPRAQAEALAWGEMQIRWHMVHGERVQKDICAGCRRPNGPAKTLGLIDGNNVHLTDDNACLLRHGERWRAAATRALTAIGLRPPTGTTAPVYKDARAMLTAALRAALPPEDGDGRC